MADAKLRELERATSSGGVEALLEYRAALVRSGRPSVEAAMCCPRSGMDWLPLARRWVDRVAELQPAGSGRQAAIGVPGVLSALYWLVLTSWEKEPYAVIGRRTGAIYSVLARSHTTPSIRFVHGHLLDSHDGMALATVHGLGARETVTKENAERLNAALGSQLSEVSDTGRIGVPLRLAKFPTRDMVREWLYLVQHFGGTSVASQQNKITEDQPEPSDPTGLVGGTGAVQLGTTQVGTYRVQALGLHPEPRPRRGGRRRMESHRRAATAAWRDYRAAPYYLWADERPLAGSEGRDVNEWRHLDATGFREPPGLPPASGEEPF